VSNIQGTGKADFLQGTNGADLINGKGGADLINGNAGNDTYTGGAGFDSFWNTRGGGVDTVTDYQMGELLIFGHGRLAGGHHILQDGETWTTSTGEIFHAYQDSDGAAHLEFTDAIGQVGGIILQNTEVTSLYTGWFSWDQVQPDMFGYTAFGGLRAY
jgi:Ca2+-binding RTX toxin-like protein